MTRRAVPACIAILLSLVGGAPAAEEALLIVRDAPPSGLVLGRLRLPASLLPAGPRPAGATLLGATATSAGRAVPVQVLPDSTTDPSQWRLVMKLPGPGTHQVALTLQWDQPPPAAKDEVLVRTRHIHVHHLARQDAGLPHEIDFASTKKAFSNFHWNDRVYDPKRGSFLLRHDRKATVELVSRGPLCDVIRTRGAYCLADGTRAPSGARATYEWIYFHDVPLVHVRATVTQDRAVAWRELHFLELNFPDKSFPAWAGGEPLAQGTFTGSQRSFSFGAWGLLRDGDSALGVLRSGTALLHDGRGGYGTYLHARGTQAWTPWSDRTRETSAWLWIGSAKNPVAEVRRAAENLPTDAVLTVTTAALRRRIAQARRAAADIKQADSRRQAMYRLAMAEKLEAESRWPLAAQWLDGTAPEDWATVLAGDLAVTLEPTDDGLRCQSLFDLAGGVELTSSAPLPLFALTLRKVADGQTVQLAADAGWGQVDMEAGDDRLDIRWRKPKAQGLADLQVLATARADAGQSRVSWSLKVVNPHTAWALWDATFPQVALRRFGELAHVLIPAAAGRVEKEAWHKPLQFRGQYPSGWATMQLLAAYDATGKTGLYFGLHDPAAGMKDILAESRPAQHDVRLAYRHRPPHMLAGGKTIALGGVGVWQVFRGDWFDAAMIYRDWVRAEASWVPQPPLGPRGDTPPWMRELCIWGMLSGEPKAARAQAKAFADLFGLPCGFHWYNWHKIPFDNDYPHYFPPRDGFKDVVADLQRGKIHIMPYINGRLWDTRDKGSADFEFSKLARPAATKDVQGKVHTEVYGSKEADGSPVRLAVMCPATKLWQERVSGIVKRLLIEQGTRAVYIDQVAAARPRLCFDATHGHPTGGGAWWVPAYAKMLTDLRAALPADRVLTTECNAEPYLRWFDGYLTWHWQYQGQVPLFPAVYGGMIQMFGRAYRGGPTKDRALRMKAGQQLVWGEQIGWISASVVKEKANAAFLKQMAWLRHRLVRYFHSGQMARPPRVTALAGGAKAAMPTITADWQWHGVWPVTIDAIQAGAWELPDEKSLVLLFVNVSDKPVAAEVSFDAARYGLAKANDALRIRTVTADGAGRADSAQGRFTRKTVFAPDRAVAWVIEPARE